MDEFNPILQEFRYLLSTLNSTKATISNVTTFCLSHPDQWETFMEFIEGEMEEAHTLDDRMNLLYLVDSICQTAARKEITIYADGLSKHEALFRLFVGAFEAAEKSRKENDTFARFEKIMANWRSKQLFSGEVLDPILAEVGRRLPVRAGNQELLKWMDEDRRQRKMSRIDKCFRPEGFTTDDEFEDMWAAAVPCKTLCKGKHVCIFKDFTEIEALPDEGGSTGEPAKEAAPAPEAEATPQAATTTRKRQASPLVEEEEEGEISTQKPKLDVQRCRIWDLDETLIVFQTMLKMKESNVPRFAEVQLMKANPRRRMSVEEEKELKQLVKKGYKLAGAVEGAIYHIQDTFLLEEQIERLPAGLRSVRDLALIDDGADLSGYDFENDGWNPRQKDADSGWYRKLAYRMRHIEETYNRLRDDPKVQDTLYRGTGDKRERFEAAGREVDQYTKGWITAADTVLKRAKEQPTSEDVIVTASHITAALAKLLVFGLAKYFPAENVYHAASSVEGKEKVFAEVMQRFGRDCHYTVIGDDERERKAGRRLGLDVRQILELADLKKLMGPLSNQAI